MFRLHNIYSCMLDSTVTLFILSKRSHYWLWASSTCHCVFFSAAPLQMSNTMTKCVLIIVFPCWTNISFFYNKRLLWYFMLQCYLPCSGHYLMTPQLLLVFLLRHQNMTVKPTWSTHLKRQISPTTSSGPSPEQIWRNWSLFWRSYYSSPHP